MNPRSSVQAADNPARAFGLRKRHSMLNWLAVLAAAFIALTAARPAQAADDPPGRVGRLGDVQGQVWMFDAEPGEWITVERNRPITGGDRLQVERGGRAELRIGSTTLRLDGGSDLEMRRLDDQRIDMMLNFGSVALRVRSNDVANEIELATPEGRFLPRRSGHYRIDRQNDTSYATAWSGELRFEAHDSALAVTPGRRTEFWQEGPDRTTHYTWSETEQDAFSDWVARANRDDDRSTSARYVSPEMTGYEDLDRNGRWDSHPDYGALWIPTTVVAGWAPYRYGHWAFIRPWGWTWVDDAPWGFAPFHYGRWVYWRNHWCWAPGQRVVRPVYAPALVAWVGGPNVSIGISIGGAPAPAVGWVPLAPREVYWPNYRYSPSYLRNLNGPHWRGEPPQYRQPGTVPTGPIMYSNTGVPGAVTVVPSGTLSQRTPVAPAAAQADSALLRKIISVQAHTQAPPPPASRVVAVPGGAVPVPQRPTPPAAPVAPAARIAPPRPTQAPPGPPPAAAAVPPAFSRGTPPAAAPQAPAPTPPRVTDLRERAPGQTNGRPSERIPQRQGPSPQAAAPAQMQPPPRPQVTPPIVVPPAPVPPRPQAAPPSPQAQPAVRQPPAQPAQKQAAPPQPSTRRDEQERQQRGNEQRSGPKQQMN